MERSLPQTLNFSLNCAETGTNNKTATSSRTTTEISSTEGNASLSFKLS